MSGPLYSTTANLGLKKIKDGERYWGALERENLDKLDLIMGLVMASGKIKIGLTPKAASLSGRVNEPQLFIVEGNNNNWHELRYPTDVETVAKWIITGSETCDFFTTDNVSIVIRYRSTPTAGNVRWAVSMGALLPGGLMDAPLQAERLFPVDAAAVLADGINEVRLSFNPTSLEITPDYPLIIAISRKVADAGDTMNDYAKFLEASIELDLPKRTPTFTNSYNNLTMVGGVPDPSNMTIYYDAKSRISESIETIAGMTRHMYFTYDTSDNLTKVISEWDGIRRTETYTFDEYRNVKSMSAIEEVI